MRRTYTFRKANPGPLLVIAFVLGLLALLAALVVGEVLLIHWGYQSCFPDWTNGQAWGATALTMIVLSALQTRVRRS